MGGDDVAHVGAYALIRARALRRGEERARLVGGELAVGEQGRGDATKCGALELDRHERLYHAALPFGV